MGLVDTSGNSVASYTYDPYGKVLTATGALAEKNPLRYRGYYYDSETGFYYLQSRYYDPATRRFVNADSYAGTGQGLLGYNMFAYCNNNPIMYRDSSGNISETVIAILVGAIVTVIAAISNGIANEKSGGSFWTGFFVAILPAAFGYAISEACPAATIAVRIAVSVVTDAATDYFDGRELDWGAYIVDAVIDGCFSTMGYDFNPIKGELENVVRGLLDGSVDIFESFLFEDDFINPKEDVKSPAGNGFGTMGGGGYGTSRRIFCQIQLYS